MGCGQGTLNQHEIVFPSDSYKQKEHNSEVHGEALSMDGTDLKIKKTFADRNTPT